MHGKGIPAGTSAASVIAAWPRSTPLAALTSGASNSRHSRWTILSAPTGSASGYPLAVDSVLDGPVIGASPSGLPFTGGWIGWVSYEAGALIEPAAKDPRTSIKDEAWPNACFLRCPGAFVHDATTGLWSAVGDIDSLPELDWAQAERGGRYSIGQLSSRTGKAKYLSDAASVIGLIHAGDAFQVNLAHHLEASFTGDARACFLKLVRASSPWFGAYIERPDGLGAICSLSPELFLEADFHSRSVTTRPIKGTRPGSSSASELQASEKDGAELAMIVDLMRNDLGRVCEYGSVRVTDPQAIERHANADTGDASNSVIHGVATVVGQLREEVGLSALLEATFPPGSITGAPKIRAMQIINQFEPLPRGPYCGAIGFISDSGIVELNVAIRTASIVGAKADRSDLGTFDGKITFPVGAGLVADSDPEAEWRETLDKAAAFIRAAGSTNGSNL